MQVLAKMYGWISGAWQKNPLAFGYSGSVEEAASAIDIVAGNVALAGATVPAGEIWVITSVSWHYAGTAPTSLSVYVWRGALYYVNVDNSPTAGQWYQKNVNIVMKEDDELRLLAAGTTLNDDMYLRYIGYRIDIDQ